MQPVSSQSPDSVREITTEALKRAQISDDQLADFQSPDSVSEIAAEALKRAQDSDDQAVSFRYPDSRNEIEVETLKRAQVSDDQAEGFQSPDSVSEIAAEALKRARDSDDQAVGFRYPDSVGEIAAEQLKLTQISDHRPAEATQVSCPLCGPAPRSLVGHSNDLPVVQCVGCGLMYVAECPAIERTLDYFRDEHVCDMDAAGHAYVFRRKHQLRREAARLRHLRPHGGRLLDVGTATGLFLRQFHDDPAWQVEGVEPSEVSAEFARQEFGLTIHQGYLCDLQCPDEQFDVVCSLDTFLCHREPADDMLEFFRLLRPGGLLAIEIPGHRFRLLHGGLKNLVRRSLGRSSSRNSLRLNAGVNYFYFTRSTLTALARRSGFELVASYPEAMPRVTAKLPRLLRYGYDLAAAILYRCTGGHVNVSAKEFCIYRKSELESSTAAVPSAKTSGATTTAGRRHT